MVLGAPRGHVLPQVPQLAVSDETSTHLLPHTVSDAGQEMPHTPLAHIGVAEGSEVVHLFPHAPQLLASL